MPTGTEWENTTSTVACAEGTPYPHEILSCKTYGTSLKCCDWHREDIDEELDIICWETWCLASSDGCWKYKQHTCNNYTPLKQRVKKNKSPHTYYRG